MNPFRNEILFYPLLNGRLIEISILVKKDHLAKCLTLNDFP
jgi:hypothetical protein